MVGINSGILSTEVAPFGGVKESGIGREVQLKELMNIWKLNICALEILNKRYKNKKI